MTVASETQAWAKGPLIGINYGEPCPDCAHIRGGEVNLVRRRWRLFLPDACRDRAACTETVRRELDVPAANDALSRSAPAAEGCLDDAGTIADHLAPA